MQLSARCFRRLLACVALALASVFTVCTAHAQSAEYQLKAATVYRIVKYVTSWPDPKNNPELPLVIGVIGEDTMGDRLTEAVAGRRIEGRLVIIKRITALPEIDGCHVVFVGRSQDNQARDIIRRAGRDTLTLGESPVFVEKGGMFLLQAESSSDLRIKTFYEKRNVKRSKLKFREDFIEALEPLQP